MSTSATQPQGGMVLAIASGKGGTGKTTVAVNMAAALARSDRVRVPVQLLDCDVEEPNDHLFLNPKFTSSDHVQVLKPAWEAERCTGCGKCAEACRYNALAVVKKKVLLFPELCHACGVCSYVCPEDAVHEVLTTIGVVESGAETFGFRFGHGKLNVGETLAPAVVRGVKAKIAPDCINILDSSPGTACPVVEAVRSTDVALMVTEPTPFGLNDLSLAAALSLDLGVPTAIVVNRSDGEDTLIVQYAERVGIPIVGRIPFRRDYAEAYSRGELLVDEFPEVAEQMIEIFERTRALIGTTAPKAPTPEEVRIAEDAKPQHEEQHAPSVGRPFECTIISGKGGTGKTTVAASLAVLSSRKVLADCDVDAADLHLLLKPVAIEACDFIGGLKATIIEEDCTACGRCAEMCHFDAIVPSGEDESGEPTGWQVDDVMCEGCGLCELVCPDGAVETTPALTGHSYLSVTPYGLMSHARLGVGEENSGKLVTRVRERAQDLAHQDNAERIIADGSPGTSCPVIASVSGTDLVLIVTEPTLSGVHDMERVLQLAKYFSVPAVICINKADLKAEEAMRIHSLGERGGARVVGHIPFDAGVNDALMAGLPVVEHSECPASVAICKMWDVLRDEMKLPDKTK